MLLGEDNLESRVRVRFFLPPPELAPFVSTLYSLTVECGDRRPVVDRLHPEWANIRILAEPGDFLRAAVGDARMRRMPRLIATGPTSKSARFEMRSGRLWGIGLLPLGWLRLTDQPACDFADTICDVQREPAFADLRPLTGAVFGAEDDIEAEAERLIGFFIDLLKRPARDEDAAPAVLAELVAGEVASVGELAQRTGLNPRTLERLALRAFGFPPKLMLRRQRFLRSIAKFMLDPSLSWLKTLDHQYYDQAHFVRDFRRFMAVTPREYAAMEHPVLGAAARARAQLLGEAVQGLHRAAPSE